MSHDYADFPPLRNVLTRLMTPLVTASADRLLNWRPEGSVRVNLPGGQTRTFGDEIAGIDADLTLRNFRVIAKSLRRGAIGFGDAYVAGDIDSSDLVALFRFFVRNRPRLNASGKGFFRVRRTDRAAHAARRNCRSGSRRNIAEHYDLGNAFYRAWLDADLTYSSGYYAAGADTLEVAQGAKLDLIAELLDVRDGDKVLEIGSGWGALAARLASTEGADVTGLTLSAEQLAHAEARVGAAGLGDRVRFRLQDYRDAGGSFDRVVSVEMIEAVGEDNWSGYFDVLSDRLKPGGVAVVQGITIDEDRFETYRRTPDFIQRYIFPGGMLPTRAILAEEAGRAGLVLDREVQFGACYARTLASWRARFEAAWPEIERLGFDDRFRRKWRYYLAYCEAGFLEGLIDVGAYRFVKPAVTGSR